MSIISKLRPALFAPCLALTVLIFGLAPPLAQAQFPSGNHRMDMQQDRNGYQVPDIYSDMTKTPAEAMILMDGPVDPALYVVGPQDVFYVAVWGPVPVAFTVPVTPAGDLIVPTVGEVPVADLTLAEAKEKVTAKIRESYRIGNISVSLLQPRRFTVELRGAVLQPGQYVASSVDRVDRILRQGAESHFTKPTVSIPATAMTGIQKQKFQLPVFEGVGKISEQSSLRNIVVVHKNGDTSIADIQRYHATGISKYNPYLVGGDVIYVPYKDLERNSFSIHGAVNSPGTFEFVEGDRLIDAIHFAEGLRTNLTARVAVIRHADGTSDSIGIDIGKDVRLRAGDRIFVDPASANAPNQNVELAGEVFAPGNYPIEAGVTTLGDVISLAGGLTDKALPAGSAMFRKRELLGEDVHPMLKLQEVVRTYPFVPSDSMFFLLNNQVGIDPVNVNMQKVLVDKDPDYDVPLQDGDMIFIARDRRSVLVQGQVRFPGYIPVRPGADVDYYIEKAGGFTEYADDGGIRIIKRATQSWLEPDEGKVESGDVLWVPKEPVRDFAYYLSVVRDIGVVLGSMVTIGLIIVQIRAIEER